MMKWVFLAVLLGLGGLATGQLAALVVRWNDNMTETARVGPGERAFGMPAGTVPRSGGELHLPREERETAAARRNPVPASPESIKAGGALYAIYCTPCHGESGKGEGLVSPKFVPPPDLTNADLQKGRTDGYWQSYLGVGGAVMPAYGEALSPEERWHVVNYLRTLARR
jgi:S-disulfanyl-L-cysteine oxidoreductase SoxD